MRTTEDFFDKPSTKRALWILLWGACATTVALEFLAAPEAHFEFGRFMGFNALFGFVSCAVLILLAKGLGFFLKRREGYYDE
ncbi:MAG: hypothetical protein AAGU11_07075 [Syntrophobacteraceae bacterium]